LLFLYIILLFSKTHGDKHKDLHWGSTPIFHLAGFGVIAFLIIGGFLIGGYYLLKRRLVLPIALGVAALILGYGNHIGFDFRSYQLRFFWPIYLAVFLGLLLHLIIRFISSKMIVTLGVTLVLTLLLLGLPSIAGIPSYSHAGAQQGLMNQNHWDIFTYLREQTPQDATVYFVYNDIYNQNAILRNTQRIHFYYR